MASVANSTGMFNVRHRYWSPFRGLGVRLLVTRNDCSIGRRAWTTWHVHLETNHVVYRMLDLTRLASLSLSVGPRAFYEPGSVTHR